MTTVARPLVPTAGVDLHLHTLVSDGRWTPEELTDAVIAAGVAVRSSVRPGRPLTRGESTSP